MCALAEWNGRGAVPFYHLLKMSMSHLRLVPAAHERAIPDKGKTRMHVGVGHAQVTGVSDVILCLQAKHETESDHAHNPVSLKIRRSRPQ